MESKIAGTVFFNRLGRSRLTATHGSLIHEVNLFGPIRIGPADPGEAVFLKIC